MGGGKGGFSRWVKKQIFGWCGTPPIPPVGKTLQRCREHGGTLQNLMEKFESIHGGSMGAQNDGLLKSQVKSLTKTCQVH